MYEPLLSRPPTAATCRRRRCTCSTRGISRSTPPRRKSRCWCGRSWA